MTESDRKVSLRRIIDLSLTALIAIGHPPPSPPRPHRRRLL